MPRKLERDAIVAELSQVTMLLESAKEYSDFIGERQFQRRKEILEEELRTLENKMGTAASLAVFFNGDPVRGTLGIAVDFAAKLLQNFQEVVSREFAANVVGELATKGRIPFEPAASLMITGVTRGSFGFILDELSEEPQLFDTSLKSAVSSSLDAIARLGGESEERFQELTERLDGRTVKALRDFFKNLDVNGATVRFVENEQEYLLNRAQVKEGRRRIDATEVSKNKRGLTGELWLLPGSGQFELVTEGDVTIRGSSDQTAIEDFRALKDGEDLRAGQQLSVVVSKRTIQQTNRPDKIVYRLLGVFPEGEIDPNLLKDDDSEE